MNLDKYVRYVKSGFNVLLKPNVVNTHPIYIQIDPTSYCNLSCKSCGRDSIVDKPTHLTFDHFKKYIDIIKPFKVAMSGTGEPFMNPQLLEMVKYAKEKESSVLITTNFTLINEKKAEQIVESGLDLLKISIDATNRETYLKIRGKDYFDKILESVDLINRIKDGMNSKTPYLRFQFVIQSENYKEIPKLIDLAVSKRINAIYLQPLLLTYVEDRKEFLSKNLMAEELKEILCESKLYADKKAISTNIDNLISNFDLYFHGQKDGDAGKRICIMPWFSLFLSADGFIRPCCSFGTSVGDLGNILQEDFKEIWNNDKYLRFRKLIKKGKAPFPVCKDCIPPTLENLFSAKNVLPGFLKKN